MGAITGERGQEIRLILFTGGFETCFLGVLKPALKSAIVTARWGGSPWCLAVIGAMSGQRGQETRFDLFTGGFGSCFESETFLLLKLSFFHFAKM